MTRICERCNQDADTPSERCDHPEIRETPQPGDWVSISELGMLKGRDGRVSTVRDNGTVYVVGDGFGAVCNAEDLTVIDPPPREPWLDENYATDTDGFLAAYAADDNTFWRMDSGHAQNVIDELIDRNEKEYVRGLDFASDKITEMFGDWPEAKTFVNLMRAVITKEKERRNGLG